MQVIEKSYKKFMCKKLCEHLKSSEFLTNSIFNCLTDAQPEVSDVKKKSALLKIQSNNNKNVNRDTSQICIETN